MVKVRLVSGGRRRVGVAAAPPIGVKLDGRGQVTRLTYAEVRDSRVQVEFNRLSPHNDDEVDRSPRIST